MKEKQGTDALALRDTARAISRYLNLRRISLDRDLACCRKVVGDRAYFVVSGREQAALHVYDAATLRRAGRLEVPRAEYIDLLAGSSNPQDPYVYYSTQRQDVPHQDRKQWKYGNAIGRADLRTMQLDGQTGHQRSGSADMREFAISVDGSRLYLAYGAVAAWSDQRHAEDDGVVLQMLAPPRRRPDAPPRPVPDAAGSVVADGSDILSRLGFRAIWRCRFHPLAFFRDSPFILAFNRTRSQSALESSELLLASANDYRVLDQAGLPREWLSNDSTRRDFRQRPFVEGFADDARQLAIAAFAKHLVILPLANFQLPAEKSLLPRSALPTEITVGETVTLDLTSEVDGVRYEFVRSGEDPQGLNEKNLPNLGSAGASVPVDGTVRLTLAAALNADQTIIYLADVKPLSRFPAPQTIRVGQEEIRVLEIDTFQDAVRVQRTRGTPHSVTDPVVIVAPAKEVAGVTQPELPVVDRDTFRWAPKRSGAYSIRMRATAGELQREWYWDVRVKPRPPSMPFRIAGIRFAPGTARAVVWGHSFPPGEPVADTPDPHRKYYIGIYDFAEQRLLRQREISLRIHSAALDKTGVYAMARTYTDGGYKKTPTKIVRLGTDDLEAKGVVDVPAHGTLQVIAGRYLVRHGRFDTERFVIPELTPVQGHGTPGRIGNRWLWDGILWDQKFEQPQLLVFPYLFGATPPHEYPTINVANQDNIVVRSNGASITKPTSAAHAYELYQYPAFLTFTFGVLNVYSHANPPEGKRSTVVPTRQIDALGRNVTPEQMRSLLQVDPKEVPSAPVAIASEADVLALSWGGLYTLPLSEVLPTEPAFLLEHEQSLFALSPDRTINLRYRAPGAVKYDLKLLTTLDLRDAAWSDVLLAMAESDTGDFKIRVESDAALQVLKRHLAQLPKDWKKGGDTLTNYMEAITPAYRKLVGRNPREVPVPVYAIVIAYTKDGVGVAELVHSYLVDVPRSALEAGASGRGPSRTGGR